MIMNRAVPVIILLFNYAFAQPGTAESRTLIQAEATVEIQYDGHVGSGVILMTSDPACCTALTFSDVDFAIRNWKQMERLSYGWTGNILLGK
jgi:hypothetical protein